MVSAAKIDGAKHTVLSNLVDTHSQHVSSTRGREYPSSCVSPFDRCQGVVNRNSFLMIVILSDNDLCTRRIFAGFDDSFT